MDSRRNDEMDDASPFTPSDADEIPEDQSEIDHPDDKEDDEEEGEDLIDDRMMQDYQAIPQLDRYDEKELDQKEYEEMTAEQRMTAERAMRKRDFEEARRGIGMRRIPAALLTPEGLEEEGIPPRQRRRLAERAARGLLGEEEIEEADVFSLEDAVEPIQELVLRERPRREIARRFRSFLTSYANEKGQNEYVQRLTNMCSTNSESLEIHFQHLTDRVPILAVGVADCPKAMLEIFDQTAFQLTIALFPEYSRIKEEIHCRIVGLPVMDALRELRHNHLNALVRVRGVVTQRTSVMPELKIVRFNCTKCGAVLGPFRQTGTKIITPSACSVCQGKGGFEINDQQTVYRNYQRLTLQESPGSVPPGRVPRTKDVILSADLIDSVRPGEECEVTGIYTNTYDTVLNAQQGFPVFASVIEANYISKKEGLHSNFEYTEDEVKEFIKLSKEPNLTEIITNSIAPSIYGHENIKLALALSLFGGMPKEFPNKHRIRGDINVLVLGDPGTAKSQFLKYIEKTSHRAVYTTGKGASAVGLTAAVHKDSVTREWTLQGGALVLADQGVCIIDEFDKMNDQDRTSIHEAMEQQSISISKAGIVTSLSARCAVIAAANPIRGRYDSQSTFAENINLTDTILTRFDVLLVVLDKVDMMNDMRMATHILDTHNRGHPLKAVVEEEIHDNSIFDVSKFDSSKKILRQDFLRKYILYARMNCRPRLQNINEDRIAELYAELRRESEKGGGGMPIAARHIESIIRLSESNAKIHLRDHVREDDVDMAIKVLLDSFISSQKYSVMRAMRAKFRKYVSHKQDLHELLYFALTSLLNEEINIQRDLNKDVEKWDIIELDLDDFTAQASELGIHDLTSFFKSQRFLDNGFALKGKKILKNLN